MSESVLPLVTRNYLEQLRSALEGVPDAVAAELVAGAREELAGLDAAAAAVRIEELGDPAFIAAEARAEVGSELSSEARMGMASDSRASEGSQVPGAGATAVADGRQESRGMVVFISLLIALGGFVVPVVGWVVGVVLMWLSGAWHTWEKWLVTVGPIAVGLLSSGVLVLIRGMAGSEAGFASAALFGVSWSSILMALLLTPVFGVWALVRAYPRTAPR